MMDQRKKGKVKITQPYSSSLMRSLILSFISLSNDDFIGVMAGNSGKVNLHQNLTWKVEYGDWPCDETSEGMSLVQSFQHGTTGYFESGSNNDEVLWVEFGLLYEEQYQADHECSMITRLFNSDWNFDDDPQQNNCWYRRHLYSMVGANWKELDNDR